MRKHGRIGSIGVFGWLSAAMCACSLTVPSEQSLFGEYEPSTGGAPGEGGSAVGTGGREASGGESVPGTGGRSTNPSGGIAGEAVAGASGGGFGGAGVGGRVPSGGAGGDGGS